MSVQEDVRFKAPAFGRSFVSSYGKIPLERWTSFLVAVAACVVVFWRLGPADIFTDSTPTGGDMGAHVWGPAFLRDHLLPSFQLRGWSPDWYAGFPAMQFYMVLPYLFIVVFDLLLPYGVAFKLVAISGVVLMPLAAWSMGRLSSWREPLPGLMAVAALLFVFDFNFTIYGGNIASTLAGEFAFSMGLAASLLYLGLVHRVLEHGTHHGRAAVVLAVVALCHPITLLFSVSATLQAHVAKGDTHYSDMEIHRSLRKLFLEQWLPGFLLPPLGDVVNAEIFAAWRVLAHEHNAPQTGGPFARRWLQTS